MNDPEPEPDIYNLYLASRISADLMWYPGICLVRDEHVEAIRAGSFSGVDFRKVNLYRDAKCSKPLDGYKDMKVIGRARVDLERSGVDIEYQCPLCGARRYTKWKTEKGLHFREGLDDLQDLFMMEPEIAAYIFVKARFAKLIIDMKLRPAMLTRVEDMQPFRT